DTLVNLPSALGHLLHFIPPKAGIDRAVLINGRGIAIHGAVAFDAVVESDAAPRDEASGHPGDVIYGLSLHLGEHQAMVRHITHIKGLPPGDENFEAGFALHDLPSSEVN